MVHFEERYFPTYKETKPDFKFSNKKMFDDIDRYFIYKIENEEEIVFNWVDKWFKEKTDRLNFSCIWSIKKVDENTALHLYNRYYNPFSILILPQYRNETHYALKATIHSIDDSSYGVWFNNLTFEIAKEIETKIAEYIDSQKILNGDLFFNFARELGATDFDTN